MRGVDWINQKFYFADGFSAIPKVETSEFESASKSIFILRNQPIEAPLRMVKRLQSYFGIRLNLMLSPYDDSFSSPAPNDVDAIFFWVDTDRMNTDSEQVLVQFLEQRRDPAIPQVLITNSGSNKSPTLGWAEDRDVPIITMPPREETATSSLSGLQLSPKTMLDLAREILLKAVALTLFEVPKLMVIDLDNTLYSGVLSEDGVEALHFSEDHIHLNRALERVARQGVQLLVVTRNRQDDIDALRKKWPAALVDQQMITRIVAVESGKGETLSHLLSEFRVAPASVLVIDDNPGELADMLSTNGDIWPVLAQEAQSTTRIVEAQSWRASQSSSKVAEARRNDARAMQRRADLLVNSGGFFELHQKIKTRISARLAHASDVERITELSARTNQFNMNSMRYTSTDINRLLIDPHFRITICEVSDKLADSGIVGVLILETGGSHARVIEFLLSCRILGRGLEDALAAALLDAAGVVGQYVEIRFTVTDRNSVARTWLKDSSNSRELDDNLATVDLSQLTKKATASGSFLT